MKADSTSASTGSLCPLLPSRLIPITPTSPFLVLAVPPHPILGTISFRPFTAVVASRYKLATDSDPVKKTQNESLQRQHTREHKSIRQSIGHEWLSSIPCLNGLARYRPIFPAPGKSKPTLDGCSVQAAAGKTPGCD